MFWQTEQHKKQTNKKTHKKVGLGITKKGKERFSAVPENLNEKAVLIIYKAGQFILAKRTTQRGIKIAKKVKKSAQRVPRMG